MSDHPLPKPPFTDRERAAYDWLVNRYYLTIQWWFDEAYKVQTPRATYPNIIAYAQHLGWEG